MQHRLQNGQMQPCLGARLMHAQGSGCPGMGVTQWCGVDVIVSPGPRFPLPQLCYCSHVMHNAVQSPTDVHRTYSPVTVQRQDFSFKSHKNPHLRQKKVVDKKITKRLSEDLLNNPYNSSSRGFGDIIALLAVWGIDSSRSIKQSYKIQTSLGVI